VAAKQVTPPRPPVIPMAALYLTATSIPPDLGRGGKF